jgi:acetyl-CoA synthetase
MPEPGDRWVPDLERWARVVDLLEWETRPEAVHAAGALRGRWLPGGRFNVATTCVDRHALVDGSRVAVSWEGEPGDVRELTYGDLAREVRMLARALRGLGVGAGDVVALHLGLLPEMVVAMLACARIGAVHAIVPTPLPTEALADRLAALSPKVLFTQDGAWRRGAVLPLKVRADEAVSVASGVEHTIVVRRTGIDIAWYEGDCWYHDLLAFVAPSEFDEAPALPTDHPLLLVNLAHRRGRPVVVTHGTGPLLLAAAGLHVGALGDGDRTWCAGDPSWLAVQTHGVYGPLSQGGTIVLYEGTLDVPTHARAWEIVRRHGVTTLLTTPSVLRTMQAWSASLEPLPAGPTLRRVVTFGEPGGPDLHEWVSQSLGQGKVVAADGWGQVELCGIVRVDGAVDEESVPDAGLRAVDPEGHPVPHGQPGELVLTRAWPSMIAESGTAPAATDAHWTTFPGWYATGDRVRVDGNGRIEFLGRTDEVLSLSGQLVSITEVTTQLLDHPFVQRADVVERRDQQGGRYLAAVVVLDDEMRGTDVESLAHEVLESVRETLGGVARPRMLLVLDRFGDEIGREDRRRAIASLPFADTPEPKHLTWCQVLAAFQHLP